MRVPVSEPYSGVMAAYDSLNVRPVLPAAQAAILSAVAAVGGAGVSFAPLYERIWGGMMLHPACPLVDRASYYRDVLNAPSNADSGYGMCVTAPAWFAGVAVLCVIVATVATAVVLLYTRRRFSRATTWAGVIVVCACALAVVFLNGSPIVGGVLGYYAILWMLYAKLPAPDIVRRVWLSLMVGAFPVLMTEYALSDEVNISGGVILGFSLTCLVYAVTVVQRDSPRLTAVAIPALVGWCCAAGTASGYLLRLIRGGGRTDFCPALSATDSGGLQASCTGPSAMTAMIVTAAILLVLSGITLIAAGTIVARRAMRSVLRSSRLTSVDNVIQVHAKLPMALAASAIALLTVAYIIAFTLA